MGDRLTTELWEALRRRLVDGSPALRAELAEREDEAWRHVGPTDAATRAVQVLLRGKASLSRCRRSVHQLLEGDSVMEGPASGEEGALALSTIRPAARRRIESTVQWLHAHPPGRLLDGVSGPAGAVRALRRRTPALQGLDAWRWLEAIGYPVVVPDRPKLRWLNRLGRLGPGLPEAEERESATREFLELGAQLSCSQGELELLLRALTEGTRDAAALCGIVPTCGECPLAPCCNHAPSWSPAAAPPVRSLKGTHRTGDMPREKALRLGVVQLDDAELLAILLRSGRPGENVLEVARRLLKEVGDLGRLASLSPAEFHRLAGVGVVGAVTILAALELARRRVDDARSLAPIHGARGVFDLLRQRFVGMQREEFVVLLLNTKNEVMRVVSISVGTLNQSLVHPRESFQAAVREGARAVIFAHNHPSGDPRPSKEDHVVTRRLVESGDMIGIPVLDHVIVGRTSYYSFADEGTLKG